MKGIIYSRVSSKEQIEGTSLEVQEAACRDYARANDIAILQVFEEQGESAKVAHRTRLLELLEYCRTNKGLVDVLIVWKVDRFARNVADHYSVKATLSKYGVRIVSVTEPIDSKPEGKLMETILAGFAEFDNSIRAMRTVQGMRRKIQEGIFPWKAPLGYKSPVASGEKKTQPDIPDPTVFSRLQKGWREFATGAYTQAEIGRLMGSWGLTAAGGKSFSRQSLYQLFTNRYYAGILADPWGGQEHEGKHVPMVTREEFARVQNVIAKRNRSRPHRKERPEFPLRGVIRCDSCMHYLTASFSRGRSRIYGYYHCLFKSCPRYGKSSATSDVHEEFIEHLDRLAPKDDVLRELRQHILTAIQKRQIEGKELKERHRSRASLLDRELNELIRMRAQGLITDEEFLRQKKVVLDQRHAIEPVREKFVSVEEVRNHLDEITLPLVHLRDTWESLGTRFRQRFHRFLLPAGFVRGQIGTAQTGLIFNALSALQTQHSSEVPPTCESWNLILSEIAEFHKVLASREESGAAVF